MEDGLGMEQEEEVYCNMYLHQAMRSETRIDVVERDKIRSYFRREKSTRLVD